MVSLMNGRQYDTGQARKHYQHLKYKFKPPFPKYWLHKHTHKLPYDLESIGIIVHQAMKLTQLLVSSFLLCHSIVDIVSASPSGFMKSSLTHIPGTLRWNMTGTWTPIASQAGAHILCLYAEDSVR